MPLEAEEAEDCPGRNLPWSVSWLSHRPGAPVLGPYVEETELPGCMENHQKGAGLGKPRLPSGGEYMYCLPTDRMERGVP